MTVYDSVVFDLDGTLVDSSDDITAALNVAIGRVGGRELCPHEVVPLLGEGSTRLVERALALAEPSNAVNLEQVHEHYRAEYRAHPAERSFLYEGVAQALAILEEAHIVMGVCTNKSQELAEIILERLGIGKYFGCIVGNDVVPKSKPDPGHVHECFVRLDADPRSGLYIGDSTIDMAAATGAHVDFVAVSWAPDDVEGQRIESFFDLPNLVLGAGKV